MAVLFNNQSCYSLLDSSLRIEDLIQFAKEHSYKAIGICENRNLFSSMPFYHACIKNNIKPIIGIRAEVLIGENKFNYLIIAKNNNGYKELIKISSFLCSQQKYLSFHQLTEVSKDCFIINDVDDSYLYFCVANNNIEGAKKYIDFINKNENWLLGIGSNINKYNQTNNQLIIEINSTIENKMICVDQALYCSIEDYQATKALMAIKTNKTIDDPSIVLSSQAYLKPSEELNDCYSKIALENTELLAESINLNLMDITTELPEFKVNNNVNTKDYLNELAFAGLKYRFGNKVRNEYIERLKYELDIINRMGFHNYFLIIYDIIKTSRKRNIYIGPGRGSVVGSLVSYCLGITHVDPIANGLLFERFLNPERISMPDIDIDIPDNRRNEVIQYVKEKYGSEYVANIIAFDSLKAKAAIRDVSKVLKLSERDLEIVTSKLVDSNTTLKEIYESNPLFSQAIDANKSLRNLYDIATKIEGLPKNTTMHAAGIVISKKPLTEVVPLYKNGDNYLTQYSKDYLEPSGLIKFDLLGVRNLNIIDNIANSIQPKIDVLKLPLNDKETYKLLQNGDTNGIFQLEQLEAKKMLKDLKPTKFDDIVAAMALIRPGAKGSLQQFLENRSHPERIQYLDPSLKDILQPTYGCIIYQEQIMQLSVRVAGFTLGKADILRKAISKKNSKEIENLKNDFIQGGIANHYPENVVKKIYENIYQFGEYGFNKSHAIAYAQICYQQAYLKANYPLNFYCESLNLISGNNVKISTFIKEMKMKGISVLPPDINKSQMDYSIESSAIRVPFSQIKGLSNSTIGKILDYRSNQQRIDNIFVYYYFVNKTQLTDKENLALIKSGCIDSLKESRTTFIENEKTIRQFLPIGTITSNNIEMIDYQSPYLPIITRYIDNKDDKLNDEFEYLGLYLNGHPVSKYQSIYPNALPSFKVNHILGNLELLGMISSIKKITTKKNEAMAFIQINDEFGTVELALMPKNYNEYINILKKNDIVFVKGRRTERNSVIIQSVKVLKEEKNV